MSADQNLAGVQPRLELDCRSAVRSSGVGARFMARLHGDKRLRVALAGFLASAIGLAAYVSHEASIEFRSAKVPVYRDAPLEPLKVDASWILEGKPIFRHQPFFEAPGGHALAGIWECEGPGKFVWTTATDETLYVLDGHSEIEYLGVAYKLHPGSVAVLPAGAVVHWNVPNRIRKAFTLSQPGRVRHLLRRFFPTAAAVQP